MNVFGQVTLAIVAMTISLAILGTGGYLMYAVVLTDFWFNALLLACSGFCVFCAGGVAIGATIVMSFMQLDSAETTRRLDSYRDENNFGRKER